MNPYLEKYIGQQIDNYRITKFIGSSSSGLGGVFLGTSPQGNVAIKILERWEWERKYWDIEKIKNFFALLRHPHIVQMLDVIIRDDTLYLVMEYMAEGTLRQKYPKGTVLSPATTLNYVRQAVLALQHAHNQNIVHSSIHPKEMFLRQDGSIALGGFEAKFYHFDPERDPPFNDPEYTSLFYYMAPEILRGKPQQASDQYSLAVITYEWLSGSLPFDISEKTLDWIEELLYNIIHDSPISLRERSPAISPAIEAVIMKALAKDPQQRFPDVEAFAFALEQASNPSTEKDDEAELDRVGEQFGSYQIIKRIGMGGFADVYQCRHTFMNTDAALKVLHTRLNKEDKQRFENEARTIANLKHPNIVSLLEFGIERDTPYFVMDLAAGTLRDRHPKGSVLPLSIVLAYIRQITAALQYAHNQRILHRDVKPENMLIGPHGTILLSDFGLATLTEATVYHSHHTLGTPIYMAPEQFRGDSLAASDQYALGIIIYEWLNGKPPFYQGNFLQLGYQHDRTQPEALLTKIPSLPPAVEQVVMTALAKDPKMRFASVQAFARALEQAAK